MLTPTYNPSLVILSVAIAMLASFAALNFAAQVTSSSGRTRYGWLLAGASVMGIGIWSMHFVGMLAFHLPVVVAYDLPLMLLSVGIAIAASLLALLVVSRREMSSMTLLVAGLFMGGAIAGMHYVGMASMSAAASLTYRLPLVVTSVLIAVAASIAALWLAFRLRFETSGNTTLQRTAAAAVMGIAIAGMHYTAMAAAQFAPAPLHVMTGRQVLATDQLAQLIAEGTLIMIALALVGLVIDRRVLEVRVRLIEQLETQAALLNDKNEELQAQAEVLDRHAAELEMLNQEMLQANHSLEDALESAERAGKAEHDANLMRTRFVNMASHELRTPLGAIGGYVQLMLMGIHGSLTEEQTTVLKRVEINQQHLLRLLNEMLELAKLEAGQMPLHLSEFELHEILLATRPMIEPQLLAKRIDYHSDFELPVPKVRGDAEKVQQIMINLLANSIKFTPASGSIHVSATLQKSRVEIRVSDSGPGIPADKISVLFTPFLQLDGGQVTPTGTGLGLAISRELARAMGGELELDGSAGAGATFILTLEAVSAEVGKV